MFETHSTRASVPREAVKGAEAEEVLATQRHVIFREVTRSRLIGRIIRGLKGLRRDQGGYGSLRKAKGKPFHWQFKNSKLSLLKTLREKWSADFNCTGSAERSLGCHLAKT